MIWIRLLGRLREEEKLMTWIVEAVHKPGRYVACVCASSDLHESVLTPHGHALIKNEAFA